MTGELPAPLRTPVFPDWWPTAPASSARAVEALPRITVVTPSFNQAPFLEATLRSVLGQGYPNLDYIVVDGGSRDGSVEIIRQYAKHLSGWVSEPDRGQVDAILKGLARADGEWFNWINSDDLLAPDALWRVAQATAGADVVAGSVVNFSARGLRSTTVCRKLSARGMIREHLGGAKFHQPGVWLRREALLQTGINLNRHYKFDYELLLRYLNRFPRVRYVPDVLAYFRLHEDSKTVTQGKSRVNDFKRERVDILRELAQDDAFSALRAELELSARQNAWIMELAPYADQQASRWRALARLWREVRADPEARCIRHTRRVALQALRRGLWPHAWSREARRHL